MQYISKWGSLGAVLLALISTSCKESGSSSKEVCEEECDQLRECNPAQFDQSYESLDECYAGCAMSAVEECIERLTPAECKNAHLALRRCVVNLDCDAYDDYNDPENEDDYPCLDKVSNAAEACADIDESIYNECYE